MADLINPQTFIESIKKGSAAPVEQQTTVVTPVEDSDPSAVGGLMALGATVLGATALGRRIPGVRNYFKVSKAPPKINTYSINKPVETGNLPTATGQASELVTTGRDLVVSKSRMGEVQDIPFSYGAGYKATNPLVGSPAFDRVMEAPFDKAPAKQWIKWLDDANRGDLRVTSGPLAGVSRQVQREELADLNLYLKGPDGQPSGFLQYALDNNLEIDRDMLLTTIKNSPINKIKKVVLDIPGAPESDITKLQTSFRNIIEKIPDEGKRSAAKISYQQSIDNIFDENFSNYQFGGAPFSPQDINTLQQKVIDLSRKVPEVSSDAREFLRNFNATVGEYNLRATSLYPPNIFKSGNITWNPKGGRSKPDYYPRYKGYGEGQYNLLGGENFTENVYVLDSKIPNTTKDAFKYVEGSPHYFDNKELVFARFDDLPNPKLGGVRHIRLSEVQSDLHSSGKASSQDTREKFFRNRVNTFNADAQIQDMKMKRQKILDQLTPYTEIGRGALTRNQEQAKSRLMYQLQQLDKNALSTLSKRGTIEDTTYGPLGANMNDYVIKDLLRTMAEKNINAISVVPAPINQNIKGLFSSGKIGNEINYGLMDGTRLTRVDAKGAQLGRGQEGSIIKSSKLSDLNESLKRIAKQYGAKYEIMPMPKSNPNKRFKLIEEIEVATEQPDNTAIQLGRKHFNTKKGKKYIYENHLAAADDLETINMIKAQTESRNSMRGKLQVIELSPDSPKNYEMVPTLVAPNEVLKKFLLPFKAYMYEGGFVDKTNIFKPIL